MAGHRGAGRFSGPRRPPVGRLGIAVAVIGVLLIAMSNLGSALTATAEPSTSPAPVSAGTSASPLASPPSASPPSVSRTATVSPTPNAASQQTLLDYLRREHRAVFDRDGIAGNEDDITAAKLDLILKGGASIDAAPNVAVLARLTVLDLALGASELGLPTGIGIDRICPLGATDLSSVTGADVVFGTKTPVIAHVVGTLETLWTGRLTLDGRDWTFDLPGPRAGVALAVLEAMTEGRAITSSGC